jgi:hypothetical protein
MIHHLNRVKQQGVGEALVERVGYGMVVEGQTGSPRILAREPSDNYFGNGGCRLYTIY